MLIENLYCTYTETMVTVENNTFVVTIGGCLTQIKYDADTERVVVFLLQLGGSRVVIDRQAENNINATLCLSEFRR